jgi:hypothetical protein
MLTPPKISKQDAAVRQLCTAIRMFFANEDCVAVHTLACASREIFEKHCKMQEKRRMFDFVSEGNPEYTEKQLWNLINDARNFFKHPGTSLADEVEFDDILNDFALLAACLDCTSLLSPNHPPEVEAFQVWFLATEVPDTSNRAGGAPSDENLVREKQRQIDSHYPGLRVAPRNEKKRFGLSLIDDVRKGRLSMLASNI